MGWFNPPIAPSCNSFQARSLHVSARGSSDVTDYLKNIYHLPRVLTSDLNMSSEFAYLCGANQTSRRPPTCPIKFLIPGTCLGGWPKTRRRRYCFGIWFAALRKPASPTATQFNYFRACKEPSLVRLEETG